MNNSLKSPFSLSPDIINDTSSDWKEIQPGVSLRLLYEDQETDYHVGILKYKPGASVPEHFHPADEHIYIISGSQEDERGHYPAGSYIFNAKGSQHSVKSTEGCMAIAHWHKPVEFI